ncbi:hypothetical protein RJT34_24831 [Clitoria ternatea]|uniref:Uncharacterized protein n=1 Tax=Clitoria ternatea TaxID=43366 RepID=A0AAN9IIC8_CLITE
MMMASFNHDIVFQNDENTILKMEVDSGYLGWMFQGVLWSVEHTLSKAYGIMKTHGVAESDIIKINFDASLSGEKKMKREIATSSIAPMRAKRDVTYAYINPTLRLLSFPLPLFS